MKTKARMTGLALASLWAIGIVGCTHAESAPEVGYLPASNVGVPDSLAALEFQGRGADSIQVIRGWRPKSPRHGVGPLMLYVRSSGVGAIAPVPGTEGVEWFAVEPGGKRVAYKAPRSSEDASPALFLVGIADGSTPRAIAPWDPAWYGPPAWASADELLIAKDRGREFASLSLTTGRVGSARRIHAATTEDERTFECVIDGTPLAFMNASWRDGAIRHRGFGVVNLRDGEFRLLSREGSHPRPVTGHYVLYARRQDLVAARFDPKAPSPIDSGVILDRRLWTPERDVDGAFDISSDGTLLMPYGNQGWSDRGAVLVGQERGWVGTAGDRAAFEGTIRAAPHGRSLLCDLANDRGRREIWELPLTDSLHARRVVSVLGGDACSPVWSPDGTELAYARRSREGSGIYAIRLDGTTPPRLLARVGNDRLVVPTSWSSDGVWIACVDTTAGRSVASGIRLRGDGGNGSLAALFSDSIDRRDPVFSPDAACIAYESGARGAAAIYVQEWGPNGPIGEPLRVSDMDSEAPVWGRRGATLYYATRDAKIAGSRIATSPRLSASMTGSMWDLTYLQIVDHLYDMLPDGRLLGIRQGLGERGPSGFQLTPGYGAALPTRMKAAER